MGEEGVGAQEGVGEGEEEEPQGERNDLLKQEKHRGSMLPLQQDGRARLRRGNHSGNTNIRRQ